MPARDRLGPRQHRRDPKPFDVERGNAMPLYEYFCDKCQKEVAVTQSMSEHAKGAACPECGSRSMRPLVGTFFSKTSRKS
jgi:putative FmdB family regulatory protein